MPEQAHGFHPHVSIAYSHTNADAAPYAAALATIDLPTVTVTVPVAGVWLIRLNRQPDPHWLYRWSTETAASLYQPKR